MRVPIYHDGKPANLPAAILDAEYWLRWLRSQINDAQLPADEVARRGQGEMKRTVSVGLRSAIEALEEFLPDEELCPLPPEANEGPMLTPVQQAKFDLIKEKLRAKQQAMTKWPGEARATE